MRPSVWEPSALLHVAPPADLLRRYPRRNDSSGIIVTVLTYLKSLEVPGKFTEKGTHASPRGRVATNAQMIGVVGQESQEDL